MSSLPARPTTPVRVPKAATTYTPASQDPDLRSQINSVLLSDGHVMKIQEHMSHALHASPTNWPSRVHAHALSLLRSGEYTTFPALMERVLSDVREDTLLAASQSASQATSDSQSSTGLTAPLSQITTTSTSNGTSKGKGKGKSTTINNTESDTNSSHTERGSVDSRNEKNGIVGVRNEEESLAVPQAVADEGLRVTRECLELVCELVD